MNNPISNPGQAMQPLLPGRGGVKRPRALRGPENGRTDNKAQHRHKPKSLWLSGYLFLGFLSPVVRVGDTGKVLNEELKGRAKKR